MADTVTYNGWSNRETWLASLWLNNDQDSYYLLTTACKQSGGACGKAEWLEAQLRESLAERYTDANMWTDLLGTAFDRINWLEVIENS